MLGSGFIDHRSQPFFLGQWADPSEHVTGCRLHRLAISHAKLLDLEEPTQRFQVELPVYWDNSCHQLPVVGLYNQRFEYPIRLNIQLLGRLEAIGGMIRIVPVAVQGER